MNEKIFQEVFDLIQEYLPVTWQKVVLYAGYSTGSYNMNFHVMMDDGAYVDCYKLGTCSKAQLIKLFMDINKVIEPVRVSLGEKKIWTVFTMIVDADGNMKTYFDYEDIRESSITYEKLWKGKFLK